MLCASEAPRLIAVEWYYANEHTITTYVHVVDDAAGKYLQPTGDTSAAGDLENDPDC